jgi:hypothetical protein
MKTAKRMKRNSIFLFLMIAAVAQGQKWKRDDRQVLAGLQQHVQYLADDALEGRRTGTKGEQLAMEYISRQFKALGLAPKGTESYYQPFEIIEGKQIDKGTYLKVNGKELALESEFFPLAYSPNIKMEALPSLALQEADMPWFWDLKESVEEGANNPHFDIETLVKNKVKEVYKRGATALFLYNTGQNNDGLQFDKQDRSEAAPIPVIYLSRQAVQNHFSDESATLDIDLAVDMGIRKRSGANVIGFLDNGAPATVVLGAHYDHLGFGQDGNSLLRGDTTQVHNGADDNASGTAALIELARLLKSTKAKSNNYLFIAFSGEELGLYGSKYFTENPTVPLKSISYMINMDMLGRLNETTPTLTVGSPL